MIRHVWRITALAICVAVLTISMTGCMSWEVSITVTDIAWEYEMEVEKYVLCEESGWTLPIDAVLIESKLEPYPFAIDEGGDEEEYRTKYYYKVWRWKVERSLETSGNDHEPYFAEPVIASTERIGRKYERYYVVGKTSGGGKDTYQLSKTDWNEVQIGDLLVLKVALFGKAEVISHTKAIELPE